MRPETKLNVCYCFWALLVWSGTFYCVVLAYHVGPFRDMWIAMDFIRDFFEGHSTASDLFSLHGGAHRLALPRAFFLVEYGLFSGTNVFLILCSALIQCSIIYLVHRLVLQEHHLPVQYRWFLVAMTVVLMFNATQLENFIYTFDMQWFLTSAAAVWALALWIKSISIYADKKIIAIPGLVFAVLSTCVSMFSSFSGLCILPVLPLLMVSYRLSGKQITVAALGVILVVAIYMRGFFSEGANHLSGSEPITIDACVLFVASLLKVWMKWTALYFGSPLGREYFWFGALFSYASLLYLAWYWLKLLRQGASTFTPFQVFCLAIALFAAMVGISTGLGRMHFVNTADEDRYQSIVLVYWLGVFAFSLSRALQIEVHQKISRYKYLCIGVIVFWTCIVIPLASIKDAQAQVNFFDRVSNVNLALATGQWDYDHIKDTLILGDKWKKINRPEQHAAFLKERKWGVFAGAEFALLGSRVEQPFIAAARCEGGIDTVVALGAPYHGYRITGHGQEVQNESLPSAYVAIDEAGQVVGLGRLQRQKNSLRPLTWQPTEQAHWLLYTQSLAATSSLQILGRLADGGYCAMASAKLPSPGG